MNEKESGQKETMRRRRLGRTILLVGLLLVMFSALSVVAASVAAFTGMAVEVSAYTGFAAPLGLSGVLLILVGLTMLLLPDGPSRDGVWVMMMGPCTDKTG